MSCRQRGRGRTLAVIELISWMMMFFLFVSIMGDFYEQVNGLCSSADE
jgi:hypothetical protein